jgi:hypothetical protein
MAYLAAKTVIFFNQSLPPREGGEEKRREEKRREEKRMLNEFGRRLPIMGPGWVP